MYLLICESTDDFDKSFDLPASIQNKRQYLTYIYTDRKGWFKSLFFYSFMFAMLFYLRVSISYFFMTNKVF